MSPTLQHNDVLFARRLHAPNGNLRRGDIVTASEPGSANRFYVKRVVGLPCERLELADGLLSINGQHLYEPYLNGLPAYLGTESRTWQMSDDGYFLMGDNRAHSTDSREYGPVVSGAIVGRVSVRLWPPGRWRKN